MADSKIYVDIIFSLFFPLLFYILTALGCDFALDPHSASPLCTCWYHCKQEKAGRAGAAGWKLKLNGNETKHRLAHLVHEMSSQWKTCCLRLCKLNLKRSEKLPGSQFFKLKCQRRPLRKCYGKQTEISTIKHVLNRNFLTSTKPYNVKSIPTISTCIAGTHSWYVFLPNMLE